MLGTSLSAPQASASVTLVQHASKDAGSTSSSSLAFPAANTSGNWLAVVIRAGHSGQVFTVTDSSHNTYKQAVQFNQTLDGPNGETLAIYYAENIAGGANTVTVSESLANNTLRFAILEYSGVATSNSLDVTSAAQGSGTTLNSGTATTTVGGDLILGEVTTADGVTYTAGSGYVIEERVPAAPNTKLIAEDAVQVAAGAVSAGANLSSSDNGGALLAAFKAASGVVSPSITNLNPGSGPVGTSVTISGSNFGASQGSSTVTFSGVAATPTSWSATSIVAAVPTGATSGNVVVTVGGSSSNGMTFTVLPTPIISSLNPTSGPPGTPITIAGSNFGATGGTVTFNGVPVSSGFIWGPTSISVSVPASATTGNVVVIAGRVASNGVLFPVTPAPVITSLSPASGAVGTTVTIVGAGFGNSQGASTVSFAGTPATPSFWSLTSIYANVPAGATSGNVVVTVGGLPSNAAAFTVTPISVSVSPTTASVPTGSTAGFQATVQNDVRNASVTWSVSGAGCAGTACGTFGPTGGPSIGVYTAPSVVPVPPTVTLTATSVADPTQSGSATITITQAIPTITSLNPTSGLVGASATITGTNFGNSQGTSTVTFNGTAATPTRWSATSIVTGVPSGASTGNVVVTVGGAASSGTLFTVLPSISSFSPTSGPVGTSVTITGNGFGPTQGTSTVAFNGAAATPTSWSTTSIVVPVPAGATTGLVTVTVGGAASNGSGLFMVPPSIASLSPTSGTVGTSVTITGTNFGASQGASTVTFNGVSAGTASSWGASSITVNVPSGATTGNVVVTVGGQASNGLNFAVTVPPPSITSLSPTSAPVTASVTITGTNFGASQGTSTVTFNGALVPALTSWSATSIVAPVPAGATTGNVVVTVGGVASNRVVFTVMPTPTITSLSLTSGPVGSSVLITGANFGPPGTNTVTFNGTAATIFGLTGTTVSVIVPGGATTGNVVVTVLGVASNGVVFTVTPAPTISSLSPASGPAGTPVTIAGANFGASQGTGAITFNGSSATPTSWSTGSIVTSVPAGATTGPVFVTVSGGVPSNGVIFTVVPAISSLSPVSGPVGTSVTITGTSFGGLQGTSTVTFNGVSAGTASSWSPSSITVNVPFGATTGNVVVTVGGQASNGLNFTVVGPAISGLSPNNGPVGAPVTIFGTNFGASQGTSTVTFNGVSAGTASSWSASSIGVNVPSAATTGNVVVTVGGVASNGVNFTVNPISVSIQPTTFVVPVSNGTSFTATVQNDLQNKGVTWALSGAGCSGASCGSLNGSTSSFTNYVAPSAVPNPPTVTLTAASVSDPTKSASATITVVPPAANIISVTPNSAPLGTSVTISGTNFGTSQGASKVSFNGAFATPTAWSDTSITAPVPAGTTSGNLYVIVNTIPSNGVPFNVTPNITSVTPNNGSVGTLVAIAGTGFGASQGTSTVTFGGVSAGTAGIWGSSGITVNVPSGATTGSVVVTVGGQVSNGVTFTVTAPPAPVITSLSPPLGLTESSVTISGANFGGTQGTSTVTFSGVTAGTASNWSGSSITVKVPSGATTGSVVVTVGGVASNGSNFTVTVPSAPIALVQHTSKDAGTTSSSSLAFKSNNTAGNWIAVAVRAGRSGQIFTVSDSLHNTYRKAAQLNVTVDTPNGDTLGIFYAENISGGANTVTVSDTISGTLRFAIFEYSGVALVNSLDAAVSNQGTSNSPSSGNAATSANGDLLLGALMTGSAATYSAGPGYKIEEFVPAEPNSKLIAEDQIQTTTGSTSAAATLASSDHWGAILAAFRAASGASPTSPTITGLTPSFGPVGTAVTIAGTNFGASQGTSTITLNGTAATPSSWSATSIVATVPAAATTGTVVVTAGGVASNGVTFTVTPPLPSLSNVNPSSAIAGSGAFTLTVSGANFVPSSTVLWNGSPTATFFVSNTQLQASITAGDLASAGVARVSVSNPGFGGGVSNASTFLVGSSGGSNFGVIAVNQAAQDIVYDPKNGVFYLSVTGTASSNPDTISVLDPGTATISSAQPAGQNPNVLAISDDGQFLYAGIDGAASVQRFTLPGPSPDISYALGSGPFGAYFALDLQVAPGTPHTTAVTLGNAGLSPAAQGGIMIFDDATPRATSAPGNVNLFDSLQWGADSSTLFASNTESTGFDFYALAVSSNGVTLTQDFPTMFTRFGDKIHFDRGTKLVYSDEGHVINPSTGLPVGNFNTSGPLVVDSGLNTAFFLSGSSGVAAIQAFDLTHFTPIGSITVPGATGTLSRLIRWGQNGLAFISSGSNGSGQVFLVGGSLVGPAPAFTTTPPPIPVTPPVPAPNAPVITSLVPSSAIAGGAAFVLNVNGTQFDPSAIVQFNGSALATTFVSSTQLQATVPAGDIAAPGTANIVVANPSTSGGNSSSSTFYIGTTGGVSSAGTGFAVQIVNQASKDIVFDPADGLIYVSVPNTNSTGNTIAVLDPATLQIVGEQYAGSNPHVVAISDDGQFLYAGVDGSSSVQRFILPGLSPDISYSLGAGGLTVGPYFALDLQVAPGFPHTTAATRGDQNSSIAAIGGIEIFDDAVARPTIAKGFGPGGGGTALYDSLQWGFDATALYAANNEDSASDFYALSVNSSGVVLSNDYPNTFSTLTNNRIHFDRGTKLIYADDGHVVDPATGLSAGNFGLAGLMIPDSALNLAFFVTVTNGIATVHSFGLNFIGADLITISGVSGHPLRLIRWGQNGLAFNTDSGQIVLIGGNFVH